MNPHDEWLVANSVTDVQRQYLIHTTYPRFIGELFVSESVADYDPAIEIVLDSGEVLANIHWIDPAPPSVQELSDLRQRASDALDINDIEDYPTPG